MQLTDTVNGHKETSLLCLRSLQENLHVSFSCQNNILMHETPYHSFYGLLLFQMLPFQRAPNNNTCASNHYSHPELPKRAIVSIPAMEILMQPTLAYFHHLLEQALFYRDLTKVQKYGENRCGSL